MKVWVLHESETIKYIHVRHLKSNKLSNKKHSNAFPGHFRYDLHVKRRKSVSSNKPIEPLHKVPIVTEKHI